MSVPGEPGNAEEESAGGYFAVVIGEAADLEIARGRRGIWGLDAAMRAACKKLKVERATPHDLRRTHGSTITALGFGRDAMNRIQNHKEGGIASVYDRHGYAEETKRIMDAVAARLMALVEGAPAGNVLQMPMRGTQ